MTNAEIKMMEKLGLTESDFEASNTTDERLSAIEDALIELAEIICEEE